ncbi:MAG TPA: ABC transporter substrate-binding protein [Xanthobacteraceae bacterium]|jgi:putative ABC transport system substrate-binding protein
MRFSIGRRLFLSAIGGAAACPFSVRAQHAGVPVIGYLSGLAQTPANQYRVAAFRQGLGEQGYVEGRNVEILYRWADAHFDRLPELAADLVHHGVAVIVATSGTLTAVAAKSATTTIPIVFAIGRDPVELGLVASLNRPGGNITGVNFLVGTLLAKRLQLLHEMVPGAASVGFLVNPEAGHQFVTAQIAEIENAARTLGVHLNIAKASTPREIEPAFASLAGQRIGALLVHGDPLFSIERSLVADLAARYAIPASYGNREIATAGGLMSYAASFSDAWRLTGTYAGRILKGEKPADLPVQQSTDVELVLNLKTAKALGLAVPLSVRALATEVIE